MIRMAENRYFSYFILILQLLFFIGCSGNIDRNKMVKPDSSPSAGPVQVPGTAVDVEDTGDKQAESEPEIKTSGFTGGEMAEIKQDGYLSYFYRRKYSNGEKRILWQAVNRLFPHYSEEDRLLATRSALAYHWVVYRTTFNHDIRANIAVLKKYRSLIESLCEFHQIPPEMAEGVMAWENSGGCGKRSWAECVGVGQLSVGAMRTAHEYYVPCAQREKKLAGIYRKMAGEFPVPFISIMGEYHGDNARRFDVAGRHREMRLKARVEDERLIPACNIEDGIIYLKLLYGNYANRMDLAISAYHNGGLNNNDIIRNYLKRVKAEPDAGNYNQKDIISAIDRYNLGYIDLWKDYQSRQMLNGLRTVYGHVTHPGNRHLSLGDESDIYPWKVVSALGALYADEALLEKLVDKYRGPWDLAECRGLPVYDTVEKAKKAIGAGWISPVSDRYVKNRNPQLGNIYVMPEMAGLLYEICNVYRTRTGNAKVLLPIRMGLSRGLLEKYPAGNFPDSMGTILRGVAVETDSANAPYSARLNEILNEFYLHDHIYMSRGNGEIRICINPRFGKYYFQKYRESIKKK